MNYVKLTILGLLCSAAAVTNAVHAQNPHTEIARFSFPRQAPLVLRLLDMETLFMEVSHKDRIALLYSDQTLLSVSAMVKVEGKTRTQEIGGNATVRIRSMVDMRFNSETQLYEIVVTGTQQEARRVCGAVVKAFRKACDERAKSELSKTVKILDGEIVFAKNNLADLQKILPAPEKRNAMQKVQLEALESHLSIFWKAKQALLSSEVGLMSTGWIPDMVQIPPNG